MNHATELVSYGLAYQHKNDFDLRPAPKDRRWDLGRYCLARDCQESIVFLRCCFFFCIKIYLIFFFLLLTGEFDFVSFFSSLHLVFQGNHGNAPNFFPCSLGTFFISSLSSNPLRSRLLKDRHMKNLSIRAFLRGLNY